MKILIVEDDKTLNNGIAMTLGGYEIVQAYHLAEARRLLADSHPDLVLLDINLPAWKAVLPTILPSRFHWRSCGRAWRRFCATGRSETIVGIQACGYR